MGRGNRGGRRGKAENGSFSSLGSWEDAENYIDFRKKNMAAFKDAGIRSNEAAMDEWYKTRMKKSQSELKEISQQEAVDQIRENVPNNLLRGWFVNADSDYKPKILEVMMSNPKTHNAALNIAYQNYKDQTGSKISFKKFLNTPITVYRGTRGQKTVKSDRWHSYSYNREIAKKFGKSVSTIKIKPKNTFGSLQTTGEDEILVPDFMIKK